MIKDAFEIEFGQIYLKSYSTKIFGTVVWKLR